MEHFLCDHENHPNPYKNNQTLCDEKEQPHLNSQENETTTQSFIPQWRTGHCGIRVTVRRQELIQKSKNKSTKVRVYAAILKIILRMFEIIEEHTTCISSTRIRKPACMMDIEVSKDKYITKGGNRENHVYFSMKQYKKFEKLKHLVIFQVFLAPTQKNW